MSKTEPTPGPWIVHNDGYGDYVMAGLVEIYNPHDTENRPDYDANARLIAAAPDMLAALRDLARQEDWDTNDVDPDSPVGKAWAAIAKATK